MTRTEVEAGLLKSKLWINRLRVTEMTWMGVTLKWQRLTKRDGGTTKRNGAYGRYVYEYRDKEITLEEAIDEIMKPASLRQALIEAETVLECSMCGKVVVGQEAMNPYRSIDYSSGARREKNPWGKIFWRKIDHEPEYLSFCPDCLQAVDDGKYKE